MIYNNRIPVEGKYVEISSLLGKTIISMELTEDEITFRTSDGFTYKMNHEQDCCEDVYIEDICGDINNLIGSPLVMAEEATNIDEPKDKYDESFTWTFYKFATIKGYVTIRWYGTSNGYYSEEVYITERVTD